MKQPPPHVIRTQSIQIDLDREDEARHVLQTASTLWRRRLAPDADALFSAWCPVDSHVRFERLTLELGTIPTSRFEEEFPSRFRAALEKELRRRLRPLRGEDSELATPHSGRRSALELLEHVLVRGTLPWWTTHESDFDPSAALIAALEEQPTALVALLVRIGRQRSVRYRLVRWLADPEIAALIRAIAPAEAPFILRYAEDLDIRQQQKQLVAATREDFRHAKWEIILGHLLADHGSRFNTLSFLRATLRGLAGHFRLAYTDLLTELAALAHGSKLDWRESSLPQLLLEIYHEDVERVATRAGEEPIALVDEDAEREPESASWETLMARFVAAWSAELGGAAGSRTAKRRTELAFWRVLPVEALPIILDRLIAERGLAPFSERLIAIFAQTERRLLHRRLLDARSSGYSPGRSLGHSPNQSSGRPTDRSTHRPTATAHTIEALLHDPTRFTGTYEPKAADAGAQAGGWLDDAAAVLPAVRSALETGRVPAGPWAQSWRGTAEAWLLTVFARHDEALPLLLRAWAREGRLTAAMSQRSSDTVLEAVVEIVVPEHAAEVTIFVRTTMTADREQFPDSPPPGLLRREVWQVVLSYLLSDHGSVFNSRSFLRYSIEALAARHGMAFATVAGLLAVAAQQQARHQLLRDLEAVLGAYDETSGEPSTPAPLATDAAAPLSGDHPTVSPAPDMEATSPGDRPAALPEADTEALSSGDRPAVSPEAGIPLSPLAQLRWFRRALAGEPTALPSLATLWQLADATTNWPDAAAQQLLREHGSDAAITTIATTGGTTLLARIVFGGDASQGELWRQTLAWLVDSAAAAQLFPGGRADLAGKLWAALIALWREQGGQPIRNVALLLGALLVRVGVRPKGLPWNAGATRRAQAARELLLSICGRDLSGAARTLAAEIRRATAGRTSGSEAHRPSTAAPDDREDEPTPPPPPDEPIALRNAGLVLLAPFFPELYRRCDFLRGDRFRDFVANQRAIHVLQYLATGGNRAHEYSLVLNKIFCGLNPDVPVVPEVELTDEEMTAVDQLLAHVAGLWPRGAVISPEGIRSSYLVRPGLLRRREHDWSLKVERRGWDVLLPELPWTFPGPKPGWMPEPLSVEWI
jgi:hypothetical protein